MLKFKKAKTYYWAINLLAGLAILFYGYDQGYALQLTFSISSNLTVCSVMSLVNLNEDYLKKMGIYPTTGNQRNTAALGGIVAVSLLPSVNSLSFIIAPFTGILRRLPYWSPFRRRARG